MAINIQSLFTNTTGVVLGMRLQHEVPPQIIYDLVM